MKYSIECHDMVFPKYAKMVFKINVSGNMTISAAPSLTPGKNPPGMQNGQLPKGTKVFDYTKEILVSVGFADCLAIIDFAQSRDISKHVDIFRKSTQWNKKVSIVYTPDDNNINIPKMATIYFESSTPEGIVKFYLPLSLKSLDELAEFCKSYTINVIPIKLMCSLELEHYPNDNNYTTNKYVKKNDTTVNTTEAADNIVTNEYANLY